MNVTRPILLRECNYLQVGVNYRLESESESLFDFLSPPRSPVLLSCLADTVFWCSRN